MILIGDIYAAASKDCGSNTFEQGVFSATIDKFIQAKNIDNTVVDAANKMLPSNEDAFFSGAKEGNTFQIGCWINESQRLIK